LASLLLGLLAATLGSLLGQVVLILGLSFLGALIALSRVKTDGFRHGLLILGRGMGLATAFGFIGAALWAKWLPGFDYAEGVAAISFLVGLRTEWALAKLDALTGGAA
jgi:hypothetical protein